MKVIKATLPVVEDIQIIPLADLHLGDSNCDIKLIKETINYIKNNKDVYCVLNGDIINNSTKQSVGDVYSETMSPMQQLQMVTELLEPIRDKILCVTNGNHENRTYKSDGVDIMSLVCSQLGLSARYSNESIILFLLCKEQGKRPLQYTIYINHGTGGGRKPGAKANRLSDMSAIVDADIYIHSHTHMPMIMKDSYFRVDAQHQAVNQVDKLYVNTNAYLNYGGYGEAYEFSPASKSVPVIHLNGLKKYAYARI